jgi:hypothetical protein
VTQEPATSAAEVEDTMLRSNPGAPQTPDEVVEHGAHPEIVGQ